MVLGRAELIATLRSNPIARAVRVDKLQIAALESVLGLYAAGRSAELPVRRMLRESSETVQRRARGLAESLDGELEGARVERTEAAVGGGSVPGAVLPSWGVAIRHADPTRFAARLRAGSPSVFCRVEERHVLLDCRTIADEQLSDAARAVIYALESDELPDDEER